MHLGEDKMRFNKDNKKAREAADDLYRMQKQEERELKRRAHDSEEYRKGNVSIQGAIAMEKSKTMDNLMDCMGLLERAYNTESLPVGIMDDINVFKKRIGLGKRGVTFEQD